jgi:hypothetical protein
VNRAFDISMESGHCLFDAHYIVIAGNETSAIRKARKQAVADTGKRTGWRVTRLTAHSRKVVA